MIYIKTKKNSRQDATLGNTYVLFIQIGQSGPSSHLEHSMR